MVAIIEAIHFLGQSKENIDLLRVGTTGTPFHVSDRRSLFRMLPSPRRGGIVPYMLKGQMIELFMEANSSAACEEARVLLGKQNVVDINHLAAPNRFRLDDSRQILELRGLGAELAKKHASEIETRFLANTAAPFVPIPI